MTKLVPASGRMTLEELRTLPKDTLSAHYDVVTEVFKYDLEYLAIIEEAIASYHYCDVCGMHYPMDEPCAFH